MVYLTDIQRIVDIALVRSLPGGKELSQEMAEIIARIAFEGYEFCRTAQRRLTDC